MENIKYKFAEKKTRYKISLCSYTQNVLVINFKLLITPRFVPSLSIYVLIKIIQSNISNIIRLTVSLIKFAVNLLTLLTFCLLKC